MRLARRLFKKLFLGKGDHKDNGSAPVPPHPIERWFQFDVTPLDSGYMLIS